MECQFTSQHTIIYCGNSLEIGALDGQKALLSKALAQQKAIILNARDLTRIDTPALQLLLSFIITAQQLNISISWQEPSNALAYIAGLIGMEDLLSIK